MAVLSEAERQQVWRGINRYASNIFQEIDIDNVDLRAAIDATDDWIDTNQAGFNSSLPAAAQAGLTAAQKTLIFCAVAAMRVSPEFARSILGEID